MALKMGKLATIRKDYDLLILDWLLPEILEGWTFVMGFRQAGNTASVLMLTAKDTTPDKITGLDAGADDYLVNPRTFRTLSAGTCIGAAVSPPPYGRTKLSA